MRIFPPWIGRLIGNIVTIEKDMSIEGALDINSTSFDYHYQTIAPDVFTAGTWHLTKVGKIVTLHWYGVTHASLSTVLTTNTPIPAAFRPAANPLNVFQFGASGLSVVFTYATGNIGMQYRDWTGAGLARTAAQPGSISWIVP